MTNKFDLYVTVGLPGSGKSEWCKKNARNDRYIDCDSFLNRTKRDYDIIINEIFNKINNYGFNSIYLDGLFLTGDNLSRLITELKNKFKTNKLKFNINKLIVIWFKPNIENCLVNDSYRNRNKHASITIKNAKVDNVETILNVLSENHNKLNVEFIEKEVGRVSEGRLLIKNFGFYINDDGFIESDSWYTGGDWVDCWGEERKIDEEMPSNFNEFDVILKHYLPEYTLEQRNKIFDFSVDVYDYEEYDYYGGCAYKSNYRLNVDKMYESIKSDK